MDMPLARDKVITLRTDARNFSFGVRFCHVTDLTVCGAMDLCDFFEGGRRTETGERASLSGSGVRDRPSESLKLFSRGIVVGGDVHAQRVGKYCRPFCRVPEWLIGTVLPYSLRPFTSNPKTARRRSLQSF